MRVFIATIMHEFGSTGFAATSEEDLDWKLAKWVWANKPEGLVLNPLMNRKEVIEEYFNWNSGELLFRDEDEV